MCIIIFIRNLDALYLEYLNKILEPALWEKMGFVYFLASIFIQVAAAYFFYKRIGNVLKQESERRVKEQNLLYAAIAHDLKTPMTSVQGFAKALSDGKIKPDEQQEIFDIIYRKSNSMNDMVNMLFDYAKLGTEEYKPNLTQINLCTLIRDIVAENYCDFEEHQIDIEIDIPETEILITGDKNELKRAFSNLIVNIYKHNPDGIRAEIAIKQEHEKAVVKISDSGNVIPENMDIFEPFVTENTARTAGHGSGLGLAITKRIIQRHGGTIRVSKCADDYTKSFMIEL